MVRSFIDADSFYDLDEVKDYAERNYKCLTDMGIQINESVDDVVEELMMCPEDMLLDAD